MTNSHRNDAKPRQERRICLGCRKPYRANVGRRGRPSEYHSERCREISATIRRLERLFEERAPSVEHRRQLFFLANRGAT